MDRSSVGDMVRYLAAAAIRARSVVRRERPNAAIAFFSIPSGLVARWLMATAGLPYIVSLRGSDVPGNRAVVAPGSTGLLFPLGRADEAGAALARLLADRPLRRRAMGVGARRRAETEFSWERAAQSYLELLPPPIPT